MPVTPVAETKRILVWSCVLLFLVYFVASNWNGIHNGLSKFSPFDAAMMILLVIGIARNLYRPAPPRPPWVNILVWAAISAPTLYFVFLELKHPSGWKVDAWTLLLVIGIVAWGVRVLSVGHWLEGMLHRK
jgi:hypothetical protein